MQDITISAEMISAGVKYLCGGISVLCAVFLVIRNWSSVAGLFSKISLPNMPSVIDSTPNDPRFETIQCLDHLEKLLLPVEGGVETFSKVKAEVWEKIPQMKVEA